MILFGHPTGNPNSHHAALAHYEAGRLEAFCVPWFPGWFTLKLLARVPGLRSEASRLGRRRFEPLCAAPKIQGRVGECGRLVRRKVGRGSEGLAYEANDWLMKAMARAAHRNSVTAVHSYEDCSLWQFQAAKRLDKQCIYDMPIGYYPWWDEQQKQLARYYADWLPSGGLSSSHYVRSEQKVQEMGLADLVLVACTFVEKTIREFHPDKMIALAPYGVDTDFWCPAGIGEHEARGYRHEAIGMRPMSGSKDLLPATSNSQLATSPLRFIYAGQSSIRKGTPVLLEAWKKAQLCDAELLLVGSWQLAATKLKQLPRGARYIGPVGSSKLRELYRESDVFVLPSFFEGFGLVILEAMACGLPVISTGSSAGPDILNVSCGRLIPAGEVDQLVEIMRWFAARREILPQMKSAARKRAEEFTWSNYRKAVDGAVSLIA